MLGFVEHGLPGPDETAAVHDLLRRIDDISRDSDGQAWPADVFGEHRVLRYLRGRTGNDEEAEDLLRQALSWRNSEARFSVKDVHESIVGLSVSEYQQRFAAKAEREYLPAALLGRSRSGNLVFMSKHGQWDVEGASAKFGPSVLIRGEVEKLEWVMWTLHELTLAEGRVPYIVVICDLEGASSKHLRGDTRKALMEAAKVLSTAYCDSVEFTIVVNASWVFRAAWAVVSPLLTARQKSKLRLFGSIHDQQTIDDLHAAVERELLPRSFGGTADPDFWGRESRSRQLQMRRSMAAPLEPGAQRRRLPGRPGVNDVGIVLPNLLSCCLTRPPSPDGSPKPRRPPMPLGAADAGAGPKGIAKSTAKAAAGDSVPWWSLLLVMLGLFLLTSAGVPAQLWSLLPETA